MFGYLAIIQIFIPAGAEIHCFSAHL